MGCWSHFQCPQPRGVSPWAAQEVFLLRTCGRSSCLSETLVFRHFTPKLTTDHLQLFSGVSPSLRLSSVLADSSSWDLSSVSPYFNFFPVFCLLEDSILFLHDGYALFSERFLRSVIRPLIFYFFLCSCLLQGHVSSSLWGCFASRVTILWVH